MKNAIISLCVLFIPVFFSCSNSNGNKFIGTWKNKQHDSIEVKINHDGGNFLVSTLLNGKVSGKLTYKLKDSSLITTAPKLKEVGFAPDINYITSSGKLSWEGLEWDKISNK